MPEPQNTTYQFGPFRLEAAERRLWRGSDAVTLTDKVFELLLLLVRHRGHALTKVELMAALWPDTVVEENNLTVNISILRKALGESGSERRYIETLARRGYRFVAETKVIEGQVHRAPASSSEPAGSPLVGAARTHPSRPVGAGRAPVTFVGRQHELERLTTRFQEAVQGHGHLVFITGSPGMGKTELCEQFVSSLSIARGGPLVTVGRCLEQTGAREPYLPFLDAIRVLLNGTHSGLVARTLSTHAPTWCGQFSAAFGSAEAASLLRGQHLGVSPARMLREMADALDALGAAAPFVLILEDLHWADPSSTDLLRLLGQRIRTSRVLVLATARAEQIEVEGHPLRNVQRELTVHDLSEVLALPLLEPKDVSVYIDARFEPHDLPRELTELVARTTEGQPLFATRLLQMLVEKGDIAQRNGRWTLARDLADLNLGVPETVRGLIERKLESLGDEDRTTLRYASVVGVEFSSGILARLLRTDEVALEERLDQLGRAHRLIEPLGEEGLRDGRATVRYRFAHVLYQNVLYEGLARKRRMAIHEQVAETMLDRASVSACCAMADVARHFEAARSWDKAIRYWMGSAENASRWPAHREAKQQYAHALELAREVLPEQRLWLEIVLHYDLGWSEFQLDDYAAGARHFELMLERARAPEFAAASRGAEAARAAAFDYFAQSWRDEFGVNDMPRMPNQEPSLGANAIQCEAYWGLCLTLLKADRLEEAGIRLTEYLRLAESSRNEPRRVEALACMAIRHIELSELRTALTLLDESIPIARALNHARALSIALSLRARLHYRFGEYEQAETLYAEGLPLSHEVGGRLGCLLGLGLARTQLGRITAALGALEEALEVSRQAEYQHTRQFLHSALGDLFLELGDTDRASAHLQQGIELAREHGLEKGELRALLDLGRACLERRELALASEAIAKVERLLGAKAPADDQVVEQQGTDSLRLEWTRTEYLLCQGELEQAKARARTLLELAEAYGDPRHLATAYRLLARVELGGRDLGAAHGYVQAGLRVLAGRPMPLVEWKLLATLGIERQRSGQHAEASRAFAEALALIEQIASGISNEALRRTWLRSPAVQGVVEASGGRGVSQVLP